jgi:hypothetical protein
MKQKIALIGQKIIRKEINGKFNNIGSADENIYKKISAAISSSVRS